MPPSQPAWLSFIHSYTSVLPKLCHVCTCSRSAGLPSCPQRQESTALPPISPQSYPQSLLPTPDRRHPRIPLLHLSDPNIPVHPVFGLSLPPRPDASAPQLTPRVDTPTFPHAPTVSITAPPAVFLSLSPVTKEGVRSPSTLIPRPLPPQVQPALHIKSGTPTCPRSPQPPYKWPPRLQSVAPRPSSAGTPRLWSGLAAGAARPPPAPPPQSHRPHRLSGRT